MMFELRNLLKVKIVVVLMTFLINKKLSCCDLRREKAITEMNGKLIRWHKTLEIIFFCNKNQLELPKFKHLSGSTTWINLFASFSKTFHQHHRLRVVLMSHNKVMYVNLSFLSEPTPGNLDGWWSQFFT